MKAAPARAVTAAADDEATSAAVPASAWWPLVRSMTDPHDVAKSAMNALRAVAAELIELEDAGGIGVALVREPDRRTALLGHLHATGLMLARLSTLIDRASDAPDLDRALAEDRAEARRLRTEIRARQLRRELREVAS